MGSGGIIEKCINDGKISAGSSYTGGIVGNSSGNIINCTNNGEVISSSTEVGGIVGIINGGAITKCTNAGTISSSCSKGFIYLGGVVGDSSSVLVAYCVNIGNVKSTAISTSDTIYCIGGVCGFAKNVSDCYNTGTIQVSSSDSMYIGGVVGYGYNVARCYNTGTVIGAAMQGGVAGLIGNNGVVENVYNVGSVSGSGSYTRAIAGNNWSGSTITEAYYLSGTGSASTGSTVKTSDQLRSDEMITLLNSSQSEIIWMKDIYDINDGYPIFVWQEPPDIEPPVVTFATNGSTTYVTKASTVVTVEDGSGLGTLMYQWTESDIAPNESTFTNTFESGYMITLSGRNGMWYLWVYAEDTLGNSTIAGTDSFLLDGIAPEGEMKITSAVYEEDGMKFTNSNNLRISITNVSDNVTSEANMKIALINENNFSLTNPNSEIEWIDYTSTINWQASNGDGLKRVYVIFKDEAGNQSLYLAT